MIRRLFVVLLVLCAGWDQPAGACTGITLVSKDGARVLARTIEWGGSNLNSRSVVVPRGYTQPILLPAGKQGTLFTAQYGYVGFAVEQEIFVAEGMNEAGLSAGLFYFPGYGQYPEYDPQQNLQLLPIYNWFPGYWGVVVRSKRWKLQFVNYV